MKILFYIQSMIAGGAQRVVATLSNHWAKKGWEVIIASLAEVDSDFYTLDGRVRRVRLKGSGPAENHAGIVANFRRIWRLRALLRQELPDVAVAMMETANVTLAFAGMTSRSVLIGAERIHPPLSDVPAHWHSVRNFGYGHLDAVVAQTTTTSDWLRNHTRARDLRVIPNLIELPLDRHDPIVVPPSRPDRRLLLSVGRFAPQKNYCALIDAFAAIARGVPNWDLAIVGDGVERDAMSERIAHHNLGSRVSLPGKAGNTGDWYARADLFAMTSLYEGFPNALLEALAHGVPAVAFDCDAGPRDLIRHFVDGLLVRPSDLESFAEALRHLMTDDETRARFASAAAEAKARFAVAEIAGAWELMFAELLARKGVAQ